MNDLFNLDALHQQAQHFTDAQATKQAKHGFSFIKLHCYTDQDGAPIYWKIRLKNLATGEKWIRSFSSGEHGFVLKEPEDYNAVYPNGSGKKPVYALDRISQAPADAEVFIFEGEQKADLANELGLTATTCGGSQSVNRTDLEPLAGRKVVIWPDNDAAGLTYLDTIGEALTALGCEVQTIDLEPLELPEKADIVDWVEIRKTKGLDTVGSDIEALERMLFEIPEEQPAQANHTTNQGQQLVEPMRWEDWEFHSLESGLYKVKLDDDGNEKKYRITSPIIVLGEARNEQSMDWHKYVQVKNKDSVEHKVLLTYESLLGDGLEALRLLTKHGMTPPTTKAKSLLIDYLNHYPTESRFCCVNRAGWKDDVFITASKTYGSDNYVFHSEGISPFSTKGTFDGWQELSRLIEPHRLALFTFACAFASTLLNLLGEESGGFHLYGSSTDGKSTITKASCSAWGSPFGNGQSKYPNSWRTTDNALENSAELRNDGYMVLDELKQATAKTVSNVAYMLANNDGKDRMKSSGKSQKQKTWNLIYMSTGEITLDEHLRRDNLTMDAGQKLRFAHIRSDQGQGLGVFESLQGFKKAEDLAEHIKNLASHHYGHAGGKWLDYLVQNKQQAITQAEELIRRFVDSYANNLSRQVKRVARRFALVASAGELATRAGITGWQDGKAFEAVGHCFNSWLADFGVGTENLEEQKILEHIKLFFESHGSSRFESLAVMRNAAGDEIAQRINNRVGYYDPDNKQYLVSPVMFESEICKGFNSTQAKKVLRNNQWIICEDGRYTKRAKNNLPDGTRPQMMHFSSVAMQSFNEDLAQSHILSVTDVTSVTEDFKLLNLNNNNLVTPSHISKNSSVTDVTGSVTESRPEHLVTPNNNLVTLVNQPDSTKRDKRNAIYNNDLLNLVTPVTLVTPKNDQSTDLLGDTLQPEPPKQEQPAARKQAKAKALQPEPVPANDDSLDLFGGML